jgi:hypothetical protein
VNPSQERDDDEPVEIPSWAGSQVGSTVEDPYLPGGKQSYFAALAFDTERVKLLADLIERGVAEGVDGEDGVAYVFLRLDKLEPGDGTDAITAAEEFFSGALPWHSRFGRRATRYNRNVFQSVRDEWRENGCVRFSMFEIG